MNAFYYEGEEASLAVDTVRKIHDALTRCTALPRRRWTCLESTASLIRHRIPDELRPDALDIWAQKGDGEYTSDEVRMLVAVSRQLVRCCKELSAMPKRQRETIVGHAELLTDELNEHVEQEPSADQSRPAAPTPPPVKLRGAALLRRGALEGGEG